MGAARHSGAICNVKQHLSATHQNGACCVWNMDAITDSFMEGGTDDTGSRAEDYFKAVKTCMHLGHHFLHNANLIMLRST